MTTFRRLPLAVSLGRLLFLILAVLSLSAEVRAQKVGYYDMVVGAGVVAEQEPPITAAGLTPVQLFNVTAADLDDIDVLFVQNPKPPPLPPNACPSTCAYGAEYLAGLSSIQNAVSAGMVLVIHDRFVMGSLGVGARTILPGAPSIFTSRSNSNNIDVSDAGTLVANGPGGVITNSNLDDGYFSNHGSVSLTMGAPPGRKGLLHAANPNQAVTVSYPFVSGFVIYSTIPLDFYLKGSGNNPPRCNFNNIYAPNVLAYAASLKALPQTTPETTTLTVTSSTGQYGGTTTLTATLKSGSTGLACRTVKFSLNGNPVASATTDLSGTATSTNVSLGSIGAGTHVDGVRADFAVSGLFNAASGTTALDVTKAPLTVTAEDKSKIYGTELPAFTARYGGFVVGEGPNALGGTLTFATPATQSSPVGPYAIAPYGLTSVNYAITFIEGTLAITPAAPLTITANDKDRPYGGTNPTFDGTMVGIQGQDNITASYATPATSSSPVGTYDIVPTLLDPDGRLANYGNPAVVNGVLTITPAARLTVTANNQDRRYGGTNPTFDGTIVGIQGEDNITASYVTEATSSSPVGTYDIVPTLLDPDGRLANYGNPAVVNGVLTIDPAPLTVTANNKDRRYGGTNPALDGTMVGIQGEDNITASYATEATPSSHVGTYDIVPTLLDPDGRLANYGNPTVVNGVLTIDPAPLTVTASNRKRRYGGTNPTFAGTMVGVQGQDNITASYATQATSSSPVGTYDIVPTLLDPGGRLANYGNPTVVNGVLTIDPAPLTVTADDKERLFGNPNPVFTVRYTGLVNDDTPASLDVQPTVTTAAVLGSPPGTYAIVVSGALDPNYTIERVNGTLTISPEGLMQGEGFIDGGGATNSFNFDVREGVARGERGSVTLRIDKTKDNKDKNDKGKDNDRFASQSVTSVIFSDDPDFAPGSGRGPQVDTVSFTGVGVWNGVGATFEAIATDMDERGRGRDTFSMTIRVGGKIVASVQGPLDGGNVQSNRLRRDSR